MKQLTKLIKVYLRQLSVRNNCERNTMNYERNNWQSKT